MVDSAVIESNEQIGELKEKLEEAKEIVILTGKSPSYDSLAAALGLVLVLEKNGKKVTVACQAEMTVQVSDIFGVNKVVNELSGKNLIISFDYVEGAVDKVSYNIEGNKFNLIIAPKGGVEPLSSEKVDFSTGGARADLVFVIGVCDLEGLGKIYSENRELFESSTVVNIDCVDENKDFGRINLVNPGASSCSEVVAAMVRILKLELSKDGASNLLSGIDWKTDYLTSEAVGPEAFEAVAYLLRAGAKRRAVKRKKAGEEKKTVVKLKEPVEIKKDQPETDEGKVVGVEEEKAKKPPDDWLTPKVYRGGQLL